MPKAEGFINRMKDGGSLVLCPYLMVKVWIKGRFRVSALLFDFLGGFLLFSGVFFLFYFLVFSDGFLLGFQPKGGQKDTNFSLFHPQTK